MDNVTIILKTFEKPRTIERTLARLRRAYPHIRVLIADDSAIPLETSDPAIEVHGLPFDTGISLGRNHVLSRVRTPYFVLMDDDHHFTRHTDLGAMARILEASDLDILAGMVLRPRRYFSLLRTTDHYHFNLELTGPTLRFLDVRPDRRAAYTACDVVHNFFLARTERVRAMGGWDERLKVGEHVEFFLRAKQAGMKVGLTTRASVDHVHLARERSTRRHRASRNRVREFRRLWMGWHGIATIVERDGSRVTRAE